MIADPRTFKMLMSFYWQGYFQQIGWIESYKTQKPVDGNSQPIPWVTYSFIDFIEPRLKKSFSLLEFGSGQSTLFYSKLVGAVHAVEHDEDWYTEISGKLPANASISNVQLEDGRYASFASTLNKSFDIIIVDGRDRVNCVKESVRYLSPSGVLVLDDSERSQYVEAINFLSEAGFKKIDFTGIAPGIFFRKSTTIFYREGNCVDL